MNGISFDRKFSNHCLKQNLLFSLKSSGATAAFYALMLSGMSHVPVASARSFKVSVIDNTGKNLPNVRYSRLLF